MELDYTGQPDQATLPTTKRTIATLPANHPTAGTSSASILNNAQNNSFHNTVFVTNTKEGPSLGELHKRVAPHAILNAGGRADDVRCHPGTREEVIGRIEKWADAQDGQASPIFWLSGPAGAGKSAIMQTIAERRDQRKVPQANFFFFRGDPSRGHSHPLVATILHQIIQLNPSLRDVVATLLSNNPHIFDTTLDNQLEELIFTPLYNLQQSSRTHRPLILLIDGLDECDSETKDNQQKILLAFDKLFLRHPAACPFRVLVASRDETQIQVAFNKISSKCTRLYLDDEYSPAKDIRIFVKAQFAEIRKTHPIGRTLDASWPSVDDIDYIVEKSSGQFIFAATVMRFMSGSSASPKLSLDRVKGAEKFATNSPFPHLDAIYTYILSRAEDQTTLKQVFVTHFLGMKVLERLRELSIRPYGHQSRNIADVARIFGYHCSQDMIVSCLQDLTSLAKYTTGATVELTFYHASFSDYIFDESRSRQYFVDIPALSNIIGRNIWENISNDPHRTIPSSFHDKTTFGLCIIREMTSLPQGVMSTVTSIFLEKTDLISLVLDAVDSHIIFAHLGNLCISDDDVSSFRRLIREWARSRTHYGPNWQRYADVGKTIRFGCRYFQMARAEEFLVIPDAEMVAALHPESDFDRRESAMWLRDFIYKIDGQEINYLDGKRCKQLREAWVSWAISYDIPYEGRTHLSNARPDEGLTGLTDLPSVRWDIRKYTTRTRKWVKDMFGLHGRK